MNFEEFISSLVASGWVMENKHTARAVHSSGPTLPPAIKNLCSRYSVLRNPDDTVWLYSHLDYAGRSESSFEWNFFEKSSLECALNDRQRRDVLRFWKDHLPFGASVANEYSYVALRITDGAIVCGYSPEYEDSATVVADSLHEFFDLFAHSLHNGANILVARFLGHNEVI